MKYSSMHIIKSIIIAVFLSVTFSSCEKVTGGTGDREPIVIQSISEAGTIRTKGEAISSNADLADKTFGFYAFYASNSSEYFNTSATVNSDGASATLSPRRYWPDETAGTLKFFSWYPYEGSYKPTTSFSTPGQMTLTYKADESATNHVDVLAAISKPDWGYGVDIHFYHTLTKVTFTFQKEDPAPEEVTISKIEFQDVGVTGTVSITDISAPTPPDKPSFPWSITSRGNIASTLNTNNTVSKTAALIGDTFLMLPEEEFSATAKIVITSNLGVSEFKLRDIVAANPHSWKSGEYINYNITVSDKIYQITAYPWPWESLPVNVVFDKQYYLNVEKAIVEVGNNGITFDIKAETNYKKDGDPDTDYPAGAFLANVNDPGSNVSSLNLGWVTVSMTDISESNNEGVHKYNIKFTVQSSNVDREIPFYINAGNMRHWMLIKQYGKSGAWLTATDPEIDTMGRYKITLTSGRWNWKVSALADPDDILLNKETIQSATGGDRGEIYFYYKASAPSGKTATLTMTNTNGYNEPVTIVLTAP